LTSPHLLVANAARPWLGAHHLRHIHRHLPFMAASCTQTPRSPLPPQVRRGAEDGKAGRRTTVGRCAPSSREDGRRARRAPHEAMTQDGETRSLRPSVPCRRYILRLHGVASGCSSDT
jgi:hypothetical protein